MAHLAIATAAIGQLRLDRLDFVVSRRPLGKAVVERPTLEDRIDVLRSVAAARSDFAVVVTDAQLIADIAVGYDVVVVGADKWHEILDPVFYDSPQHQAASLATLPEVVVVPRAGTAPPGGRPVLDVDAAILDVSSTRAREHARGGERTWMAPEAAEFDDLTGAWCDPERYDAWRARRQ